MPDTDQQLDIFSQEVPVDELPVPPDDEPRSSQIGVDDPWPEDMYQ